MTSMSRSTKGCSVVLVGTVILVKGVSGRSVKYWTRKTEISTTTITNKIAPKYKVTDIIYFGWNPADHGGGYVWERSHNYKFRFFVDVEGRHGWQDVIPVMIEKKVILVLRNKMFYVGNLQGNRIGWSIIDRLQHVPCVRQTRSAGGYLNGTFW